MSVEAFTRVAIGVAGERQDGWLHLPQAELDVTREEDWRARFRPGSIDNILAEHVWEHLTWTQAQQATRNCFRFLRPGGRLRLAVPDALHLSQYIVDAVSATGSQAAEHGHLVDYTWRLMSRLMSESGFEPHPLDWWDEHGEFHNGYSGVDEHGYIIRSAVHWPRHPSIYREPAVYAKVVEAVPEDRRTTFIASGLSHTSLIVDGVRPL